MVRSNIPSAPYNAAILAGVTATAGEINANDITAAGTVEASKAVVVDGSLDIAGFNDVGIDNDLTVGGDVAVTGDVSAATATVADLTPSAYTPVAVTASADGSTSVIPDEQFQFVAVTSANAAHWIVLPTPTPGTLIIGYVGANGCEIRSSTPGTVSIAGGAEASAESAIPANTLFMLVCISATAWLGWDLTATTLASIEAAAAA